MCPRLRVAIATVVVVALAATLAGCGDDAEPASTTAPAATTTAPSTTTTEPTTTTTAASTTTTTMEPEVALETMELAATTIVELLNDHDVAGLLEYLGPASLSTGIDMYAGDRSDSPDALVRALGFHNAVETAWAMDKCEPTGSSGRLACVVSAVVPLHQALGLSEVDSDMMLRVADDGSVTQLVWVFGAAESQVITHWTEGIEPFYDWMEQNHSEDLDPMRTDAFGVPQSDEAALELWATYSSEYVAFMEG